MSVSVHLSATLDILLEHEDFIRQDAVENIEVPTLRDWLRRPFWTWCSAFFFFNCSFTRAKSSRSTAQLDLSLSFASANSTLSPSLQAPATVSNAAMQ